MKKLFLALSCAIIIIIVIVTCAKNTNMKEELLKEDLSLKNLLYFQRANNPNVIDDFSKQSKKWRPNYRTLIKSTTQPLTWYKDKDLNEGVLADSIDVLIYLKPTQYSTVILFRTSNPKTIEFLVKECEAILSKKLDNVNKNSEKYIIHDDDSVIKLIIQDRMCALVIMNRKDYEAGLNIE